jgi:hypothetical protein
MVQKPTRTQVEYWRVQEPFILPGMQPREVHNFYHIDNIILRSDDKTIMPDFIRVAYGQVLRKGSQHADVFTDLAKKLAEQNVTLF